MSVMVTAIESHPVSVIGEVNKPGVFQVRGSKTLLEMLSMAQGLAPDAGDEVLVMRNAGYNRGQDGSGQTTQPANGKTDRKDADGIAYDSVRREGGECVAVFRPRCVGPARPVKQLIFRWDGSAITAVLEAHRLA